MKPIVNYESSSEEEEEHTPTLKRKASLDVTKEESSSIKKSKMPTLPSFFGPQVPVKSTSEKYHQGRKRATPHLENNWATYVYFQVDLAEDKTNILSHCRGLEAIPEQHISLSRTVYLKEHQLDPFIASVRKYVSHIKSFDLAFAQIAQLTNDEKTRSFVTLEVGKGYNELLACLKYIDQVMVQYHQPVFYDPPRFHTSIAWELDEVSIELLHIPQSCIDDMITNDFHISRLYIKQGHRINHIDLQ